MKGMEPAANWKMEKLRDFFEKSGRTNLLLFTCSALIYILYFHAVIFNCNALLSSITADSLKNYYTFVYHIKNDPELLHFTGMNYPYGEHVIYTDCQPLLTFILRLLPFTHNHLIGIMHGLIFFSFIISPVILNKAFHLLGIDKFTSFFVSLAIALLSPQFLKINAGHFALAYGCLIPLSLFLCLRYLNREDRGSLLWLFVFNALLFLLHPYMGFCLSLFSCISLFLFSLFRRSGRVRLKGTLAALFAGILPLVLFKLFMLLTDRHSDRTTEPYGAEMMVENLDSILSPVFGPFRQLMELVFSNRPPHYEGHTYLGFFPILLVLLLLVLFVRAFKKIQIRKDVSALLLASLVFLAISFGLHLKLLALFHIQSPGLNQFRAVCRFAWIFYFTLPVFLVSVFYNTLKELWPKRRFRSTVRGGAFLFFALNMLEANSFFRLDESMFWKYRNIFHERYLNNEEKLVLKSVQHIDPQAILPLPLFHGGSEMYERLGSNNSMIPSMIYSYHSGRPIFSGLMSRTSITETENTIQLLNSYKKEKPVLVRLNARDFFVIVTADPLLPDEKRLLPSVHPFASNDSLSYGYVSRQELLEEKIVQPICEIPDKLLLPSDSTQILFMPSESRKPFLPANIADYETLFVLDSNSLQSGSYVISFRFHYTEHNYRAIAANLIVNRSDALVSGWEYNIPVRLISGFYKGFGVFEYCLRLERKAKYEFMLKGFEQHSYFVSSVMLRPEQLTVVVQQGKKRAVNNFPE